MGDDITLEVTGGPGIFFESDKITLDIGSTSVPEGSSPTFATVTVDSLQLDLSAAITVAQGEFAWNADEECFDFGMNDATWQGGLETFYHVRNNTGSTIVDGTPVMASGTVGASGRILVTPFDGSDKTNAKLLIGFTTYDLVNGADGKVTNFGKVRGVDTSAYSDGDILWASPSVVGGVVNAEPGPDDIGMPIAFVVYSHVSAGVLHVRINPVDEHKPVFTILNHETISGATALNATTASTQTADFITSFTATLAGFTAARQSIAFEFVVASGTPTVTLAGSIFNFYTTVNLSALAAGSYVAYFKSSDSGTNTKVFVKLAP